MHLGSTLTVASMGHHIIFELKLTDTENVGNMLAPTTSHSVGSGEYVRKSETAVFSFLFFFLELDYKAFYSAGDTEYGKHQSKVMGHLVIYNRKECRMHTMRNIS